MTKTYNAHTFPLECQSVLSSSLFSLFTSSKKILFTGDIISYGDLRLLMKRPRIQQKEMKTDSLSVYLQMENNF